MTITRAVIVQIMTVSIKGSSKATNPSCMGNSDFAAEWAMAEEPTPASFEKAALRKPVINTPIKPPYPASGEKALVKIRLIAAGICV